MNPYLNETHDPQLRSWVASANQSGHAFPIQNLPFGVFRRTGEGDFRLGVAIGDEIVDLRALARSGALSTEIAEVVAQPTLNPLLAAGATVWSDLRKALSAWLGSDAPSQPELLVAQAEAEYALPATIGDYTDAYASIFHATNIGRMFRPDNPLLPNYKYVPIAYHGRASSIVPSGSPIHRPSGQRQPNPEADPVFGPSVNLDYEAELGLLIGPGNALGQPITIEAAPKQIFGICLVNDWSARDLQRWEYQPLGPFLSKSFATSLSPWVVTLEALAPFRSAAFPRPLGDPAPLPYLFHPLDQQYGGLSITVEVAISSSQMRANGLAPLRLSRGSFCDMYWTFAQLVAHHSSNGCNLRPGDLIASGTISGPQPGSQGCLLELTQGGKQPIELPSGELRRSLEDGDEIWLSGFCEHEGATTIGLGQCLGRVVSG